MEHQGLIGENRAEVKLKRKILILRFYCVALLLIKLLFRVQKFTLVATPYQPSLISSICVHMNRLCFTHVQYDCVCETEVRSWGAIINFKIRYVTQEGGKFETLCFSTQGEGVSKMTALYYFWTPSLIFYFKILIGILQRLTPDSRNPRDQETLSRKIRI